MTCFFYLRYGIKMVRCRFHCLCSFVLIFLNLSTFTCIIYLYCIYLHSKCRICSEDIFVSARSGISRGHRIKIAHDIFSVDFHYLQLCFWQMTWLMDLNVFAYFVKLTEKEVLNSDCLIVNIQFRSIRMALGFFPTGFFPARSFPRRSFPLKVFSPLGLFPARSFPRWFFPRQFFSRQFFYLRFSVATLFWFVAHFARVRIENYSRNRSVPNGIQGIACFIVFSSQLKK